MLFKLSSDSDTRAIKFVGKLSSLFPKKLLKIILKWVTSQQERVTKTSLEIISCI